jgi:ribosomal protein S27AE
MPSQMNRSGVSHSTNSNPAGFFINEKTGESCPNCGAPLIAISFKDRWFQGCSAYYETGCRYSKKLPASKPLVNVNGQQIHLQAIQQEVASRNDTLKRLLNEALTLLNSENRIQ